MPWSKNGIPDSLEDIFQWISKKSEPDDYVDEMPDRMRNIYNWLGDFTEGKLEDDEPLEPQYNCIIIDDMADALKDKNIIKALNKMLIKARHIQTAFIFTLQSYYYFPKILRKQITNITIFKPKNSEEWNSIAKELLLMNQEDGLVLYEHVFDEPYTHLDIDTVSNTLYKNFNQLDITYHK